VGAEGKEKGSRQYVMRIKERTAGKRSERQEKRGSLPFLEKRASTCLKKHKKKKRRRTELEKLSTPKHFRQGKKSGLLRGKNLTPRESREGRCLLIRKGEGGKRTRRKSPPSEGLK